MSAERRIMIAGAGGYARVMAGLIERIPNATALGVADHGTDNMGEAIGNTEINASLDDMEAWRDMGVTHVALAIGDNSNRRQWAEKVRQADFQLVTLVHGTTILEPGVTLGEGTVVCAGAILGAEVRVGEGAIINMNTIIDHETEIGAYCHVTPGCRVAGRVRIGDETLVGLGACVLERLVIGRGVIVGAGSVVTKDLPDGVVAVGAPAGIKKPSNPS